MKHTKISCIGNGAVWVMLVIQIAFLLLAGEELLYQYCWSVWPMLFAWSFVLIPFVSFINMVGGLILGYSESRNPVVRQQIGYLWLWHIVIWFVTALLYISAMVVFVMKTGGV